MKKYLVTGLKATFGIGAVLGLTVNQHAVRKYALDFVKGQKIDGENIDIVSVTSPIEFKAGEKLYVSGDVNKAQLEFIAEVDVEAEKAEAKAKKDAKKADGKKAEAKAPAEKADFSKAKKAADDAGDDNGLPKTKTADGE